MKFLIFFKIKKKKIKNQIFNEINNNFTDFKFENNEIWKDIEIYIENILIKKKEEYKLKIKKNKLIEKDLNYQLKSSKKTLNNSFQNGSPLK